MPCQSKQGSDRNYNAVERLAPGASVEALHEELLSIFDGLTRVTRADSGPSDDVKVRPETIWSPIALKYLGVIRRSHTEGLRFVVGGAAPSTRKVVSLSGPGHRKVRYRSYGLHAGDRQESALERGEEGQAHPCVGVPRRRNLDVSG
jgi:hypothetical protein